MNMPSRTSYWGPCGIGIWVLLLQPATGFRMNAAEAEGAPMDLKGTVQSKSGAPIQDARVFIYTAGPRVGNSPI